MKGMKHGLSILHPHCNFLCFLTIRFHSVPNKTEPSGRSVTPQNTLKAKQDVANGKHSRDNGLSSPSYSECSIWGFGTGF